ncbi:nucleotidyltransferase domain-containing protein (plasmid) [Bacillus pumilus]|uniref:nucleotide-binding domain-containing protein n=1 Tax=Bacillus pumilus TaxID=1408 RepID=UPI001657BDFE|nr:nucleotidyltransferase domain-containing protein [Bacillus pumilus]QNP18276.1 nucleotidyltransferase domain-containing protein [Bacillus pumilus]
MLATYIEEFVESLKIEDIEDETKRVKEITKRLNKSYYDGNESETENCYVVGSLGRGTAIKSFSDVDMLFVLPSNKKKQYNDHEGNGQSKLLQEVKKEIKKRYPKTIVRGDGQVIVVSFEKGTKIIEVCPVFENSDGSFTYPDSNHNGKWKITNPLPEIAESVTFDLTTGKNFSNICYLVRAWKNNKGFKFGGLLVDTLVYNFLTKNTQYQTATFIDYLDILKDLFGYLKDLNEEQSYWNALGSNQQVYNKNCKFVKNAKLAYELIKDLNEESENIYESFIDLFGKNFPVPDTVTEKHIILLNDTRAKYTEEFIEKKFNVDIRYSLKIECEITQNGYRTGLLREFLQKKLRIQKQKKLKFFIKKNELEEVFKDNVIIQDKIKYDVYWKVLNRGDEAIRRNCIRGEITKGETTKTEHSVFNGDHLVECYIVYKNTVVARDQIRVPIQAV